MRRWIACISVVFIFLLLSAGVLHFLAKRGGVLMRVVSAVSSTEAVNRTADQALQDSCTWYIVPAGEPVSLSGRTAGGGNGGARCSWLTGFRRELSSPVFQATDIFLTYLGRESSARSFASWRASLCGASCGGAVSVSRPGDGYIYALSRIVI